MVTGVPLCPGFQKETPGPWTQVSVLCRRLPAPSQRADCSAAASLSAVGFVPSVLALIAGLVFLGVFLLLPKTVVFLR